MLGSHGVKLDMFKEEMKSHLGDLRLDEARKADRILGVKKRIMLDIASQEVVNDKDTFQGCVQIIRKHKPEVIFTHFSEDKHRDHRAVSRIVDEACWKSSEKCLSDLSEPWYTSHLYYYEVLELFSHPSLVVDITETMERKIEAIKAHKTQLEYYSDIVGYLEALGRARGFLRGTRYAESFLESNLLPTLL